MTTPKKQRMCTYMEEPWYKQCLVTKTSFLYGNAVKYDFQIPRAPGYLDGGKVVNAKAVASRGAKAVYIGDHIPVLKGPYDLTNSDDLERVCHIAHALTLLKKIRFLKPEESYESADIWLDSPTTPHLAWLEVDFGGSGTHAIHPIRKKYDWGSELGERETVQVLLGLMLKRLCDAGPNTLSHLIAGKSGGGVMLFGLDRPRRADTDPVRSLCPINLAWTQPWFDVEPEEVGSWGVLEGQLKKHGGACLEYLALYTGHILQGLGEMAAESQVWHAMVAALQQSVLAHNTLRNSEQFGWPLQPFQRVMVQLRHHGECVPGTCTPSNFNWDTVHVPLDPFCMNLERQIYFDVCARTHLHPSDAALDITDIDVKRVRPMTTAELERYGTPKLGSIRYGSKPRPGDIVKIYEERNPSSQDQPIDIGLVMPSCDKNEYWRDVYCWKKKALSSQAVACLSWIPNVAEGGRALHVENITDLLEEDSPLKILRLQQTHFARWLF